MESNEPSVIQPRKNSAAWTALISSQLLDENLLQRYGTSLNVNMGREYQKYLDKKYAELKEEFEKIDMNSDDIISIEELTNFINTYSKETNKVYDTKYAEKVFNLIDVDKNKQITIQEFIMSYIVLEEKLRLKKIKLQKLDDELKGMLTKYQKSMAENKGERLTSDGISDNATLFITLLEAKDLKPMDYTGTSDPYVTFNVDGKKATSSYKPETLDPIWNEDFTFAIKNHSSVLKIEVWDRDTIGSDDYEGGVNLHLKDLAHQNKIDQWYNLNFNNDNSSNGQIHLRIQYIFSRYKYFTDLFDKTTAQIERIKLDIEELNRMFELFEKPYGIIIYGEVEDIVEKRILERSEDISAYMASNRRTVFASPRQNMKTSFADKFENVLRGTFSKSYLTT